jgi:hypothetical protein
MRRRRRGRPGSNPEDRIAHGDLLELGERRVLAHWEVRPRTGRELEVALQDRRTLARRHLDQADRLAVAVVQDGLAACGLHVGDPAGACPEHRHEIAAALVVGDDDWQSDRLAAVAALDFERAGLIRAGSAREQRRPGMVDLACQPVRPAACVEPAIHVHGFTPLS